MKKAWRGGAARWETRARLRLILKRGHPPAGLGRRVGDRLPPGDGRQVRSPDKAEKRVTAARDQNDDREARASGRHGFCILGRELGGTADAMAAMCREARFGTLRPGLAGEKFGKDRGDERASARGRRRPQRGRELIRDRKLGARRRSGFIEEG